MDTKEKIKVYAVENDQTACNVLKEVFSDNETYEIKIIKVAGNTSTDIEKSREEDKTYLLDILSQEHFHILILDLLLRDNMYLDKERVASENVLENVLSLEIARQLKENPNKEKFLLVFTSASSICKTHQKFEEIKKENKDKVPEDAVFIFKLDQDYDQQLFEKCPISEGTNAPICNKEKRDIGGCNQKICFFELLNKYYADLLVEE